MNEIEAKVQKHVIQLCKFLPEFVNKWKELREDVRKPLRGLLNLSEQLREVEKVNKVGEDDFVEMQQAVLFSVYEGIEEEMESVKNSIEKLNKLNSDLKNKLSIIENMSLTLDWDNKESTLIRGTALQPSLKKMLNLSLDFLIFFVSAGKNINSSFKEMDVRNEQKMAMIEEAFDVDLNDMPITNLLAITQYVNNEKGLV